MIISSIFFKYLLPQEASGNDTRKIKKIIIFSSIGMTFLGFFIMPMIIPTIFPKYLESADAIRIMSLALLPLGFVNISISKFLSLEKSRFILIGLVISLSILIPTMILFGIWYGILGIAYSFVLASTIQAVYFLIANRKLNREDYIEK